jgi:predicted RNA-binding Zn-ribbon protein involved in translation (DUF1610 family)
MSLEAPTLPCATCGVGLRVDPEARQARCRHCGGVTTIAEHVRDKARAYRLGVEAELRRLSFSEAFARGMDSGAMDRIIRVYTGVIIALAAVLTLGMMAPGFGADEAVALVALAIFVVGLALSMGAFFLALRWALRKEMLEGDEEPAPQVSAELAATRVAGQCSACGGPVGFALGEAMSPCGYCGVAVVPTEAVRARLTGLATFRADLEQARNSRSFARSQASGAVGRGLELVFWCVRRVALFIPLIAGLAVGDSLGSAAAPARRGRRGAAHQEDAQLVSIGIQAGGAALTALLLLGSVAVGRLGQRTPRRRALTDLARRYGARVHAPGTRATVEWLDAHWAAETPEGALVTHNSDQGQSVERLAVALHHRGAPVLLVFADAPHVQRFDVFVTGYDPRRRGEPSPAAEELRAAGLRVTAGRAGVHLVWPASDPRFCEPAAAVWMLDRAVGLLG